jgi:signal transduction histidine kinase
VSSLDPHVVLHHILDLTSEALDATEGAILLPDPKTSELVFELLTGEEAVDLRGRRLRAGQGVAGWVATHDRALNVPDAYQDHRFYPGIDQSRDFTTHSLLAAPMRHRGQLVGVIEMVNKRDGTFTDDDQSLLEAVASIAAVALENARLYTATRARAEELAMLNEFGLVLTSNLDFSAVSATALEHIRRLLQPEVVALLQPTSQGEELSLVRSLVHGQEAKEPLRIPVDDSVMGWVLKHRRPVLFDDLWTSSRYWKPVEEYLEQPLRSLIAVPLLRTQDVVGIIAVGSKAVGAYTEEDLHSLQALASTLTVALENARLYKDLEDLLHERERAQAQLIQTEKMAALGRLVASIAHEINNPLQAVQGCLTLAGEELDEDESRSSSQRELIARYLNIAEEEIDRISVIVRRARDFYRPARSLIQETDIHDVLESVLALSNKQLQHSEIRVERNWQEDLPLLESNPDHLKQVFLNLVLNAIDAMPDGGTLSVRTATAEILGPQGPHPAVSIELEDDGLGMPSETLSRLFEPFFTTKENGSGLGLSISYGIIQAHYGTIDAASRPGEGTVFTILLPISQPDPQSNDTSVERIR